MVGDDDFHSRSRDVRKESKPREKSLNPNLLRLVTRTILQETKRDYVILANVAQTLRVPVPIVRACLGRLTVHGMLSGPRLLDKRYAIFLGKEVTRGEDGKWFYLHQHVRRISGQEVRAPHYPRGHKPSDRVVRKTERKIGLKPCDWDGSVYFIEFSSPAYCREVEGAGFIHPRSTWTCKCGKDHYALTRECFRCSMDCPLKLHVEKPIEVPKPKPKPILICEQCGRALEKTSRNGKKVIHHKQKKCALNRAEDVLGS